jgi:hypothetical protein
MKFMRIGYVMFFFIDVYVNECVPISMEVEAPNEVML